MRNRLRLAPAWAVAAAMTAFPAQAEPVEQQIMTALQTFCMATGGRAEPAIQAADAAGWDEPPAGLVPPRYAGRVSAGDSPLLLMATLLPADGPDPATDMCGVGGRTGDATTLVNLVEAWLGAPLSAPRDVESPNHYVVYTEQAGVRRALPASMSEAEVDAEEDAGRLRAVSISTTGGMLKATLMVPRAR